MADVAVTALGADRPGIVATIAEVVRAHGGSVSRATMTRLAGHVAIVFQVRSDETPDDLRADLAAATAPLGITVSVAAAVQHGPSPLATHLLSVYGPDEPGLLAQVTRAVADSGGTIIDLEAQIVEDEPATWAMSAEVVAPHDAARLGDQLAAACDDLGLEHRLTALDEAD